MSVITQDGNSALMLAAMFGETEVVVELVKAGINVDTQDIVCQYTCIICVAHCNILHVHVCVSLWLS